MASTTLGTGMFDLTGKKALVTGGSRGLGKGFALALARAGADVVVTARKKEDLAGTVAEIRSLGREAYGVALDVREEASIREGVGEVYEAIGELDILVNNAGCNVRKPALEV
ncbi:MAG: SDR family NAD(P)-dependent oxidoreductase, partial [Verrucomicrobiales bacterium]